MRQYSEEFKEQILAEFQEVGNVALVARRHQISENTIYTWIRNKRKNGSVKPLPKSESQRIEELEKRLKSVSTENDLLNKTLSQLDHDKVRLKEINYYYEKFDFKYLPQNTTLLMLIISGLLD
ncbi:MAG: Transposase IS3/IS911 [Firmicutes bacterium]|nr:Transposase IS3/IS911 [Bacillota bacterium]